MKLIKVSLALALFAGCKVTITTGVACDDAHLCPEGQVCGTDGTCADYVDCLELTQTAGACGLGQKCEEQPLGAACVSESGCRVSKDCSGASEVCINGKCGPAPAADTVSTCEITNVQRSFAPGASIKVTAVAYDANSRLVPYQTYTVSSGGAAFTAAGTTLTAGAQASPLDVTITATFGSKTCTATFTNIGSFSPGTSSARVSLYKTAPAASAMGDGRITDFTAANFFFQNASGVKTAAVFSANPTSGVYQMGMPADAVAITIVHANYNVSTVFFGALTANQSIDLVLPLEPFNASGKGDTGGYGGVPSFTNYDAAFKRAMNTSQIRGAYAGGSLPLTTLLNFNLSLFAGDTAPIVPTSLITSISSTSASSGCTQPAVQMGAAPMGSIPLPRALYLANPGGGGLGPNCGGYSARVVPGRRIGWSLGLKLDTSKITDLAGLVSSTGIDSIIKTVLPLADTIALGVDPLTPSYIERHAANEWEAFAIKSTTQQMGDANFKQTNINPGNRLFNVVNFDNPGLSNDFYRDAPQDGSQKLTGMVNLICAVSPVYGIVPIGFGAGFDGKAPLDGKLDLLSDTDPRFVADKVHARHTYLPVDIADADIISVLIATNFADLTAGDAKKSSAIRIKGLVTRDSTNKIPWAKNAGSLGATLDSSVQGFSWPHPTKYTVPSAKVMTLDGLRREGTVAADAVIMRISRSDDGNERFWNIIFAPSAIVDNNGITLNYDGIENIVDGTNTDLTVAAIGLKFGDSANILTRLAPAYGKDLETIAGETKSFSLYYEVAKR